MKKISLRLSSVSAALEVYEFIKDLTEISSSYYVTVEQKVVEISEIPDFELEKVIQILCNFFTIGMIYDCYGLNMTKPSSVSITKSGNKLLIPSMNLAELDMHVTKFVNNLEASTITPKEKEDYLNLCINELTSFIHVSNRPNYAIGDIIRLNSLSDFYFEFGNYKSYVYAIICDLPNSNSAFIVPIIPKSNVGYAGHTLPVASNDITPKLNLGKEPTVMLDYCRLISTTKIEEVYSKANAGFLMKVINGVSNILRFQKSDSDTENENNTSHISIEKPARTLNESLREYFQTTIQNFPRKLTQKDKVATFLKLIDFPDEPIIFDAFVASYKVNKITYESIISELQKKYHYSYESTMNSLRLYFYEWTSSKQPDILIKCPKLSILSLIKFFNRNF